MDEQKLAELFRDATRDAPPASFDVAGVRSASARATARRRSAIALGSTMAVVLLFGGVIVTVDRGPEEESAVAGSLLDASSPNVTTFSAPGPGLAQKEASPDLSGGLPPKSIPEDPSTQGDEPSGSVGRPSADSAQRGCVEVDRELAVALADELPVARGLQPSLPSANCPVGARGAGYLLRDGGVYGTLSVVIAPPGTSGLVPDESVRHQSAKTSTGDELYVLSEPEEGSSVAPFAGELSTLARDLAARF